MKEFCLIGHPLGHSLSGEIHQRLFELSGVAGAYTLKDIEPDEIGSQIDYLRSLSGFNITIPYKQTIIPFLQTIDERAGLYNAVNTVKCESGEMHGYNTDVDGFLRALGDAGIALKGRVLLCGAGGVSGMMAAEALRQGCSLTIATRTIGKATKFIDSLKSKFPDAKIEASALPYLSGSFDLILNGTPAGMYPDIKSSPVPASVARCAGAVFDAVYNPAQTQLIKTAQAAGAKVQGGLTMLVWQAAAAQELWTGAKFSADDIHTICKDMASLLADRF